jgi:nitroreductase
MVSAAPTVSLPDETTLLRAVESAVRAPSIYNSQPWRWRIDSTTGIDLFADRDRHLTAIDPDGRGLLLSCGAALQLLVIALARFGWAAQVDRFPDPENSDHLARVRPMDGTPPPALARLAPSIPLRHTDRRRFGAAPVDPRLLDALVAQAGDCGADLHIVTGDAARAGLIATISRSASLERQQAGYGAELAQWTSRYSGAHDGIDFNTIPSGIDLPGDVPMPKLTQGTLSQPVHSLEHTDASILLVLSARTDDRLGTLCAGEASGAVLLAATGLGLATTPLSQPMEMAVTREWIVEHIVGPGVSPQLVIRVGWADQQAAALPPTPRRSVERVMLRKP